jgi:hypothetical protein
MVVGTGCTQVIDSILAAQDGSGVTITGGPVGPAMLTTQFVGGIDSTATVQISFFDLLLNRPLDGTVEINDMLFAGTPIQIGPFNTGAICVAPIDPNNPGGGTIEIDLKHNTLTFAVTTDAGIRLADPVLGPLVGVLPFPVDVSASSPVSLKQLLGALGGGSLGIQITQPIALTIATGPFAGATATGQFILAEASAFPTDPKLDTCRALPPL